MTRRTVIKEYSMWIYINNMRNRIRVHLDGKDGHWVAHYMDLKSQGSYTEALFGIRDQVLAIINAQMELKRVAPAAVEAAFNE